MLENDEVVFVIDQLGSSAGFAESGGNLVDAADAKVRKDELGQVFTYFGTFPRQGVYETLASGAAADGSAWVEARRAASSTSRSCAVTTRYTLQAPDRALLLETTLENTGDAPIAVPSLGRRRAVGRGREGRPGQGARLQGAVERRLRGRRRPVLELRADVDRGRDRRRERQLVDGHRRSART